MQQFTAFGRVVWGHPGKLQPKKDNRGQPVLKDGVQVQQIAFGLAVAKLATIQAQGGNPAHSFEQSVWPFLDAEAKTGYPNGVPQGFSWKWKDGDGIDREGKPYNAREGFAGHYVMTIASEFAVGLYRFDGRQYNQITADEIKTGDYVAVSINCKLNIPTDRTHTPGLYINPQGVELVGYGKAIVSGPDAQTMFGGQQYALPPGASSTPQPDSGGVGMPGAGGMPGQQPMQGGMPGQQPMQGGMPGQQPMQGGMPGQQPMQGGMPGQQPMQGGMPGQQPMQGGMPGQQPMQGGMPGQQPMQGGMPGQQPMQGGMPGQQPMQGGMPGQQPMQGGMPGQQPMQGGYPPPATNFIPGQMPGRFEAVYRGDSRRPDHTIPHHERLTWRDKDGTIKQDWIPY